MHREGLFFGRMPGQEQSLLREGACIGEWPTKGKLMLMESVHCRMFFSSCCINVIINYY